MIAAALSDAMALACGSDARADVEASMDKREADTIHARATATRDGQLVARARGGYKLGG